MRCLKEEFYELLWVYKFESLEEMCKFLENYKL